MINLNPNLIVNVKTENKHVKSKTSHYEIELYDFNGAKKILHAYLSNPYQNKSYSFSSLLSKTSSKSPRAFPVYATGYEQALYVKISDVAKMLGVERESIQKALSSSNQSDLTEYLTHHNIRMTLKKVIKVANDPGQGILTIIQQVGYQTLITLLKENSADEQESFLQAVNQLGQLIQNKQTGSFVLNYQYNVSFSSQQMAVCKKEFYNNKVIKKIFDLQIGKIRLEEEQLKLEKTSECLTEPVDVIEKAQFFGRRLIQFISDIKESVLEEKLTITSVAVQMLVDRYKAASLSLKSKDAEYLQHLTETIPVYYLLEVLDRVKLSETNQLSSKSLSTSMMLNTYLKIGQELCERSSFKAIYNGKVKTCAKPVYAYAISGDQVFIVGVALSEATGSYKSFHDAFHLNTLIPYLRGTIISEKNDKHFFSKIQDEINDLDKLGRENPYMAAPYAFYFEGKRKKTGQDKVILFHIKYPGQGKELHKGSIHQIVRAYLGAARGLGFIHQAGYVHGDFKPSNFVLDKPLTAIQLAETKIIDMGLTVQSGNPRKGGSKDYLAPEYVTKKQEKATYQLDSFSLGVSIIETLIKKYKFKQCDSLVDLLLYYNKSCFGICDQELLTLIFKDLIKENHHKHQECKERDVINQLLFISQYLMLEHVQERWTCQQAAEKLGQIDQLLS